MATNVPNAVPVPVNIVGSSIFGRYPKISDEKTYNMFISDDWLVNYAGFQKVLEILSEGGEGRALFHSVRGNFIIAVFSSTVYKITPSLAPQPKGNLDTGFGEVFIDENLSSQICIVDGEAAWIYNWGTDEFVKQTLTFSGNDITPNYVTYHNTFFFFFSALNSVNPQNWYAFEFGTTSTITLNTQFALQTKPDSAIAIKRLPGKGNNVLVIGETVCEVWTQIGGLENYRRLQSFNIDSGCVSVSTIAANEDFVCWLAQNENNAPCIMVTDGSSHRRISTDGIDYLLQTIEFPNQSTAFFFRQDGHLFWQITFYNEADNLSLIHDFTTGLFFHVCRENMDYHPARDVVYFNGNTYFISINDGSLYQMGTEFVGYNYSLDPQAYPEDIPRIRVCKTIRLEDSSVFRVGMLTFWIEQGENKYYLSETATCVGVLVSQTGIPLVSQSGISLISQSGFCSPEPIAPRVDMTFSKNGNASFSNAVGRKLNTRGQYRNQLRWWRLGQCNEFTVQLRFWGMQRFVCKDGIAEVLQK